MKLRSEIKQLNRILVKFGSSVLTKNNFKIDDQYIKALCSDVAQLINKHQTQIILVTSGAIQAGSGFLKDFQEKIQSHLQAASSVGQPIIFNKYSKELSSHGLASAQVLLTHDDFKNRTRFLNAKNTLLELLQNQVVPILNENDVVSFREITVGDNDHLAVMTGQMLSADLLLFVTSAEGLYDQEPDNPNAKIIDYVKYGYDFSNLNINSKSIAGRGGMQSKIEAVQKATNFGIPCIISGKTNQAILTALTEKKGTFFQANNDKISARKAWLVSTTRPNCKVHVDIGCKQALLNNASLLPSGVTAVYGEFTRGDCISISSDQEDIAVGVSEYSSDEINQIKGLKSIEISDKLGFCISDEVIHRDNLKLLNQ